MLREGLDLPKVILISILDANYEGFLRNALGSEILPQINKISHKNVTLDKKEVISKIKKLSTKN